MGLAEVLQAFLDHRREVLVRRARHRLAEIEARLEILEGYLDRLPQPRRGDPHHPRGGRAEAGADGALRADRHPGRGHPQHAPAQAAPAGGDGDPARARRAGRGARGHSRRCWPTRGMRWRGSQRAARRPPGSSSAPDALGKRRTELRRRAGDRRRAASRSRVEREPITVILLRRGWIRAAQGPRRGPRRAEVQGGRQAAASCSRPRPPTSCCCSPPTAASSRSPATSCRAAAATASRCA